MAAGDVSLIYCFNGMLIDEHENATYINGTTKGSTVPKSISFASFKEKVQELTNLPSNGKEIKIKCGVMDHSKFILTATEVDDDDSLRLVMDRSKFIMAYILEHVQPATTSTATATATQWQEVLQADDRYQGISHSIMNFNHGHENEVIPIEVDTQHHELTRGVVSGAEVNCQEVAHNGVVAFPSHILSQPHFDAGDGPFNLQSGNPNDLITSENWNSEGLDPNMFPLPHAGHLDVEINSSICDHEDTNFPDASNEHGADYFETSATSQIQTSAREPACVVSSDIGIALEREFPSIDALRNSIIDMTIRERRVYVPVRTSPYELTLKCEDSSCNWHIQATRLSNSPAFKVNKYQKVHACMVHTGKDHPQATVKWIASKVQSRIEENLDMELQEIVNEIKGKFQIEISINKAMKAKNEVKKGIRKRMKESLPPPDAQVCCLLVEELKRGGSVADLGLNPVDGSFEYLFWAFSACIHALRTHLRPVLFVRTEDIAIGVLMYAYGVDGNSYFGDRLEVGFAVFAREDVEAWETFMRCLKEFVPATDNNNNLPFAIVTDFKDKAILAIQNVLPDIHHFFFNYDFVRVFSKKFKGGRQLRDLCDEACILFSAEKCSENLEAIKKINEEAYEWLLQRRTSQWSAAFSPNKHVRSKNLVFRFPHFKLILEKLSIVEIVESSRHMLAEVFSRRRMRGAEMATTEGLVPRIMGAMETGQVDLLEFVVESVNGRKYQLTANPDSDLRIKRAEVDLDKRSCTCGEFQATEYPCLHAWVTLAHLDEDPIDYVTHRWYSLDTYQATYEGSLPPPIPEHISQSQTSATGISFFPVKGVQAGRPKKLQRILRCFPS